MLVKHLEFYLAYSKDYVIVKLLSSFELVSGLNFPWDSSEVSGQCSGLCVRYFWVLVFGDLNPAR